MKIQYSIQAFLLLAERLPSKSSHFTVLTIHLTSFYFQGTSQGSSYPSTGGIPSPGGGYAGRKTSSSYSPPLSRRAGRDDSPNKSGSVSPTRRTRSPQKPQQQQQPPARRAAAGVRHLPKIERPQKQQQQPMQQQQIQQQQHSGNLKDEISPSARRAASDILDTVAEDDKES